MSALIDRECIPVRAGEELDVARLEPYLRSRLPAATGPFTYRQFGGGRANLTYLIAFGDREFVLRRPPLGPLPPKTHDMKREHRVLEAVAPLFRLAPRSLLLCEDTTVVGAPFHVMERRSGFTIIRDIPEPFAGDPRLNRRIGEMLVDTLATLHRIPADRPAFQALGRPAGYLLRQLEGRTARWHAAKTDDLPEMQTLLAWLAAHRPPDQPPALVHNDFKLDNILLDARDPAVPVAVLDWDMCTFGDPLTDLGFLLHYWLEPGDDPEWQAIGGMPTWQPGFPSRAEAVARYAALTGRDVTNIGWYLVFGVFHIAVILQQIFARFARGQTRDERFAQYDVRVRRLARKGLALIRA